MKKVQTNRAEAMGMLLTLLSNRLVEAATVTGRAAKRANDDDLMGAVEVLRELEGIGDELNHIYRTAEIIGRRLAQKKGKRD